MPRRNRVGYESFPEWEELAKVKTRTLIGKYGLTQEDLEDIKQELLLHIHRNRTVGKSWKKITASRKTILDRILDNKIRDLLRAYQSRKTRLLSDAESLSREARPDEEGRMVTYETLVREDQSLGRIGRIPRASEEERRLALSLAGEKLTPLQRRIFALAKKGLNVSEMAIALGMHRTAVVRELKRMREELHRRGWSE